MNSWEFNDASQALNFTLEQESEEGFVFLVVLIQQRTLGSVQLSAYLSSTFTARYTLFTIFFPLRYKRNVFRCLAMRALITWLEDTMEADLQYIRNTLRKNGFRDIFIPINEMEPVVTMKTTALTLKLSYRGNVASQWITRTLNSNI